MNLESLHIFLSVVNTGSFSQAAIAEHLSQPAISSVINSLEKELGTKLLIRSKGIKHQTISTTPTGQVFEHFARNTINDYNATLLKITQATAGINPLSILVSATPSATIYPIIYNYFHSKYPDIPVKAIVSHSSRNIFQDLLNDKTSICISGTQSSYSSLTSIPFMEDPIILIAPASFQLKEIITPRQLKKIPLVMRSEQTSNIARLILQNLENLGIRKSDLNIVLEVNADADVLHAVELGSGAGFIARSSFLISSSNTSVKQLEVKGLNIERRLYLTTHKNKELNTEQKLFFDCAMSQQWISML